MLKAAQLLLEFWDEAVMADTYIRNRLPLGPVVRGKRTCPEQAYTGVKLTTKEIKVQRSRYYKYINLKGLLKGSQIDKLVLRGRVKVYIGNSNNITKYYKVYFLDLRYITTLSIINQDKSVKGDKVKLKIYRYKYKS